MPESPLSPIPVTGLFSYRDRVRALIHKAKIKSDERALTALVEIALRHSRELVGPDDCILPAPSSLWGRLAGRYDIAYEWGRRLYRETGASLTLAPWGEFWRLKKQARRSRGYRAPPCAEPPLFSADAPQDAASAPPVVVVDDVITTGWTLSRLIARGGLAERTQRILVFADAR